MSPTNESTARDIRATRRQAIRISLGAMLSGSAVSFVHGEDSQAKDVNQYIRGLADAAPLAMQFAGQTADECRAWQTEFRSKLGELLGPHRPPKQWKTIVEDVAEFKDHRRESLLLIADGHPPLPVHLLLPKGLSAKPRPGVVAIHGHGNYGYDPVAGRDDLAGVAKAIDSANYDYGRQFVRRGYVVACPCMTPFGRRLDNPDAYGGGDPCGVNFVRMQLLGKVLMAENLRDCLWAFELLAQHKDVAADRIGCAGLSYGGRMTMLTTAMEPRIRVASVSGALNVMQERISLRYSCGAQVIPGLLQFGDVPEIGSLIAPRPCVWETGSNDGLIIPKWADRSMQRMHRAYDALGANGQFKRDRFEGGHRWNGEVAFPLFDRVLKS